MAKKVKQPSATGFMADAAPAEKPAPAKKERKKAPVAESTIDTPAEVVTPVEEEISAEVKAEDTDASA